MRFALLRSTVRLPLNQSSSRTSYPVVQGACPTTGPSIALWSSGLSLLEEEDGRQIFCWHGVAGKYALHIWGTTPREFSPCRTILDTDKVQLMSRPDRHFKYFAEVKPRIEEALLVPFHIARLCVFRRVSREQTLPK
jgi:hypothetical protein